MANMIVLFMAVNVGKKTIIAVNPYFNQVVLSRSLNAWILSLKKRKKGYTIIKSNYDRYNRLCLLYTSDAADE